MSAIERREYQERAVEHALALKKGARVLYVGPTACGKRVIAVKIIKRHLRKRGRVLFLAHSHQLISQAYDELVEQGLPESKVGVIMNADLLSEGGSERVRPGASVQVASVATLVRRELPPSTLIIIDEAHHATAGSYRKILDGYSSATVLGFTATPNRMDGTGLGDVFDELFVIAQAPELIAEGRLADPLVYGAPKSAGDLRTLRLKGLQLSGGDYSPKLLGKAMNHRALVGDLIAEWKRLGRSRPTVVFASSVEHSKAICARFNRAGIVAVHIDWETKPGQRAEILRKLDTGEIKIVCNYNVLTEGWDQKRVRCAVLARPTRSETVYLQQAGRVMRVFGNQRAIILDHSGNAIRFGLPSWAREHSLESVERGRGGKAPCRQCTRCSAIVPAAANECSSCGAALGPGNLREDREEESVRLVMMIENRAAAFVDILRKYAESAQVAS